MGRRPRIWSRTSAMGLRCCSRQVSYLASPARSPWDRFPARSLPTYDRVEDPTVPTDLEPSP